MKPIGKNIAVTKQEAKEIERKPNRTAILALIAAAAVLALAVFWVVSGSR